MRRMLCVAAMFGMAMGVAGIGQGPAKQVTWRFDETAGLGGHAAKVLGHPEVIDTPMGKAIAFNGLGGLLCYA